MKDFEILELLNDRMSIVHKREPKLIIVTGAIAVGKTTFARALLDYLIERGHRVMLRTEIARTLEDEFKLYQGDSTKHAFFFQYAMVQAYHLEMKEIGKLGRDYDYIILDRTHIDTIPFTSAMIPDEDGEILRILDKKLSEIKFPFDIAKVIYLKPSCDNMLRRYEIRKLDAQVNKVDGIDENCSDEYLSMIYDYYDLCMDNMYPSYTRVINDNEGYDEILNQLFV
ncbi:5821_t:CDS:1 [Acaulospora morrowiae]|uniref:5821_t:CDS:1 n=1 Tax=Acaulospora morrowiae TaxID=94023 RepID=A0A9N9IP72_9GLOM|nr:5821_t:CDS:1 [Acaulospora morrowiae]